MNDPYVLGHRPKEQERLQQQALDLAHESNWLFDRIGIGAGQQVVEIGCGPQGCLDLLSQRVGAQGQVVGVERNAEAVDLARRWAEDRGLRNAKVMLGDARDTGLPASHFDAVVARLVLVNVPDPAEILAEAVSLVKPGGMVAFHEADYLSHVCDPPCDAWSELVDLLVRYSASQGIDPFIGRKLPRLLREAGLEEVDVRPVVHIYPKDSGRRTILLDFAENLSTRFVAGGLIDEPALGRLKAALREHLDDPATLVVSHLFFQAWGRKPLATHSTAR